MKDKSIVRDLKAVTQAGCKVVTRNRLAAIFNGPAALTLYPLPFPFTATFTYVYKRN